MSAEPSPLNHCPHPSGELLVPEEFAEERPYYPLGVGLLLGDPESQGAVVPALEVDRDAHPPGLWRSRLRRAGPLRLGGLPTLAGGGRA